MPDKGSLICRTCEGVESLTDIFIEDNSLVLKLTAIANIEIQKDDEFPHYICGTCRSSLESAYKFKLQCELFDQLFRNRIILKEEIHDETMCEEDEGNTSAFSEQHEAEPKKIATKETEPKKIIVKKEKNEEDSIFVCSSCSCVFENRTEYKKHLRTHRTRHSCPICHKSFHSSFHLKKHKNVHKKIEDIKIYECKECFRKYTSSWNLSRHMQNHAGDLRHICDVCGKGFIQSSTLQTHQLTHKTAGDFKCQDCKKTYKHKKSLIYHRETVHNDSKNSNAFHCDICGGRFFSERNLQWHIASHLNPGTVYKKPPKVSQNIQHMCSECGKTFKTKGQLKLHSRVHTGEQPYECNLCHERFKFMSNYQRHLSHHVDERPYTCAICDKKFRQAPHLKIHSMMHTGEKPHKCSFCNKGFALNSNLRVHLRIHTGERPYICEDCGRGFIDSNGLKKHRKKHL